MLVKSKIPTSDQMPKINKEEDIKRDIDEKNRDASERKNLIRIKDVEESS